MAAESGSNQPDRGTHLGPPIDRCRATTVSNVRASDAAERKVPLPPPNSTSLRCRSRTTGASLGREQCSRAACGPRVSFHFPTDVKFPVFPIPGKGQVESVACVWQRAARAWLLDPASAYRRGSWYGIPVWAPSPELFFGARASAKCQLPEILRCAPRWVLPPQQSREIFIHIH